MTWILTQSIFWDYTSTSLFILYMCVPFCYPLFPLIVFTLFASSGSSVFSSSTGGRNNLITLSLLPPASYFCRSQITEEKKNPCFWDTNYRFCSSFALRCWNPLSNPIKGRRENKVKVLMIMKKGLKLSICNISGESWMRPRGKEKVMTTGWAEIHAVHHNISNLAQLTAEKWLNLWNNRVPLL